MVYSLNQQDKLFATWPIFGNLRCLDIFKYSTQITNTQKLASET